MAIDLKLIPHQTNIRSELIEQFFYNDLAVVLEKLQNFPSIKRQYEYTATIYFENDQHIVDFNSPLRFRFYCQLSEVNIATVSALLLQVPSGKLQLKTSENIEIISMKKIELFNFDNYEFITSPNKFFSLKIKDKLFTPNSIRICKRKHFYIAIDSDIVKTNIEDNRITLDEMRWDFKIDYQSQQIRALGQLGPKLEIKAKQQDKVEYALNVLCLDRILNFVPYSALQLIFLDLLLSKIKSTIGEYPEIEIKFEIKNNIEINAMLFDWLEKNKKYQYLLPAPYMISRIRRCHACIDNDKTHIAELIAVETESGKISAKIKRNPVVRELVLIRNTKATLKTDLEGEAINVEAFLKKNNWKLINTFIKSQQKIPFVTNSGLAFLFSIDKCKDKSGKELHQLEIEYIGCTNTNKHSKKILFQQIHEIAKELMASNMGQYLQHTTISKHQFFCNANRKK